MPITHPYLPTFVGTTKYFGVWNSIRFLLNTLVFSCENRVQITSLDVDNNDVVMRWETYPLVDNADSIGDSKEETKLSGMFIFGLNEDCDKIVKHIVDDVQIVGKDKKVDFRPKVDNGAIVYCKE